MLNKNGEKRNADKFDIIYADPPWSYKHKLDGDKMQGGIWKHYKPLPNQETVSLDIRDLTNVNAACFLWVTNPLLPIGLKCLEAWGFEYKTIAFTWVKLNKLNNKPCFGMGYYTKSNVELCLLGVKGKMKPVTNIISSIVMTPRQEHSRKPDIIRKHIIDLFGEDKKRIELFARPGQQYQQYFTLLGNEVTGNDIRTDIQFLKT